MTGRRSRRAGRAGMLALLVAALGSPALAQPRDPSPGARLFDGREALPAQLVGRDVALPATASRCSNCHGREGDRRAGSATRIGPVLGPAALRERRARRGGPPSAYELASFCRVLRTGIDPAQVIIDTRMPRYAASDAQCSALWLHLAAP